jgi:hypothetical protein
MEKSMNPDKEDSENREDLICFPPWIYLKQFRKFKWLSCSAPYFVCVCAWGCHAFLLHKLFILERSHVPAVL